MKVPRAATAAYSYDMRPNFRRQFSPYLDTARDNFTLSFEEMQQNCESRQRNVFPSTHKAQTRSGVYRRFKDTIMIATGLLHRLLTFAPLCKYFILQRSTKRTQCAHTRVCVFVWRMWFGVRIETYEHAVGHATQTYIAASWKINLMKDMNLGFRIDLLYSRVCGNCMTIILSTMPQRCVESRDCFTVRLSNSGGKSRCRRRKIISIRP